MLPRNTYNIFINKITLISIPNAQILIFFYKHYSSQKYISTIYQEELYRKKCVTSVIIYYFHPNIGLNEYVSIIQRCQRGVTGLTKGYSQPFFRKGSLKIYLCYLSRDILTKKQTALLLSRLIKITLQQYFIFKRGRGRVQLVLFSLLPRMSL